MYFYKNCPRSADPLSAEGACAGANACQFSYDLLEWEKLFGEATQRFQGGGNLPGFYGLKTEAELQGPVGQKIRADCDMPGLIWKDDPPVFLNTAQKGGDIMDRRHLLHPPKHALAIHERCRQIGVPVVANVPALDLRPGPREPQDLAAFLFRYLEVTGTKEDAVER